MQSQGMMERSGKKELLLELSSEGFRRIELASPPVQLKGLRPNTESLGPSYRCRRGDWTFRLSQGMLWQ